MLPGALKGLGIDTNYTFINSSNPGDIYYDINGIPHHNLGRTLAASLAPQGRNAIRLLSVSTSAARGDDPRGGGA
jgi:hypothetical protein